MLFSCARTIFVSTSVAVLAALSIACGDEALPTGETGGEPDAATVLGGLVVDAADVVPVPDLLLSLMELSELRVVGVTRTDSEGRFRFALIGGGRFVPVVQGPDHRILRLPEAVFELVEGDSVETTLTVVSAGRANGKYVEVTVLDEITGMPVPGALVDFGSAVGSVTPVFSEMSGRTESQAQVTDGQGRCVVGPATPWPTDREGILTTPDLLVTRAGYRPIRAPGFDWFAVPSSATVRISPGAAAGVVTGRLVDFDQVSVAGVQLGLEWIWRPQTPATVGKAPGDPDGSGGLAARPQAVLQGVVAVSGEDGRFRFEGVPDGYFRIVAGYPEDDGWLRADFGNGHPVFDRPTVEVADAGEADAGLIPVTRAGRPVAPADGAVLDDGRVRFQWEPLSWADSYVVLLATPDGVLSSPAVSDPWLEWPSAEPPLPPGSYLWEVRVPTGTNTSFPVFERASIFTLFSQSDTDSPDPSPR